MNEPPRRKTPVLLAAGAAACLAVLAFAGSLDNAFVFDDYPIIAENRLITSPGPWYRFWLEPYWPRTRSPDKLYRPLTMWSLRANVALTGEPDPASIRATNIALHALASAGVAVLAWRVSRRPSAAWIAGALFAVHPLHTEAVVTGVGRSELLAGALGVWLMARYIRPPAEKTPPTGPRAAVFHATNAVLFLLAVMSKEHALLLWPALAAYDAWRYRHPPAGQRLSLFKWLNDVAAPAHVGFMLATSTFFFFRFAVFGWHYRLEADRVRVWESPLAHADLIEHVLTPFRLAWLTVKLLVWPRALCPIWSIPAVSLPRQIELDVAAGMILIAGLLILSVVLWHRGALSGPLLVAMLILMVLPIQALPMAHWLYAERWLYLPSVLMAVLVALALARLGTPGASLGLAAAAVLLPASWQYASKFADNLTMNREVVRRQPDNFHGRRNLATLMFLEGRYAEAIQCANEVIERFGPVYDAYYILARSYLELGDGRRALEALDQYQWLRRDFPGPGPNEERERAEALIALEARQKAAETQPVASHPASMPATAPTPVLRDTASGR